MTRKSFKGFKWEVSTRDRHWCQLPNSLSISVYRNRSWKKLGQDKPWRIEIFGSPWVSGKFAEWFADVDDAKYAAEYMTIEVLEAIAKKLGFELRGRR